MFPFINAFDGWIGQFLRQEAFLEHNILIQSLDRQKLIVIFRIACCHHLTSDSVLRIRQWPVLV
jgi:hypothetical protein